MAERMPKERPENMSEKKKKKKKTCAYARKNVGRYCRKNVQRYVQKKRRYVRKYPTPERMSEYMSENAPQDISEEMSGDVSLTGRSARFQVPFLKTQQLSEISDFSNGVSPKKKKGATKSAPSLPRTIPTQPSTPGPISQRIFLGDTELKTLSIFTEWFGSLLSSEFCECYARKKQRAELRIIIPFWASGVSMVSGTSCKVLWGCSTSSIGVVSVVFWRSGRTEPKKNWMRMVEVEAIRTDLKHIYVQYYLYKYIYKSVIYIIIYIYIYYHI